MSVETGIVIVALAVPVGGFLFSLLLGWIGGDRAGFGAATFLALAWAVILVAYLGLTAPAAILWVVYSLVWLVGATAGLNLHDRRAS